MPTYTGDVPIPHNEGRYVFIRGLNSLSRLEHAGGYNDADLYQRRINARHCKYLPPSGVEGFHHVFRVRSLSILVCINNHITCPSLKTEIRSPSWLFPTVQVVSGQLFHGIVATHCWVYISPQRSLAAHVFRLKPA